MPVVVRCLDKPGSLALRLENRPAHLVWLTGLSDKIILCGPLLSPDGSEMIGSLLVLDFPDPDAAAPVLAEDPYARAGLFESVEVMRWKKVLPA